MSNLCPYRNILGKPNQGIHSYRIPFVNLAVMDIVMTILLAVLLSWIFKWNIWIVLILCFIAGILAHRIFCVRTTIDKWLFPLSK